VLADDALDNVKMILCIRNFGKRVSKTLNVFNKDARKCCVVKCNSTSFVSRLGVNSNHICYQNSITSGRSTHNDKNWNNLDCKLLFVSAGLFNFFGLKKGDHEEEPELITTIKRGVLLTQVRVI